MIEGEDWIAANRACWDERVPIHVAGDFFDVERFVRGGSTLQGFELDEIGDVRGCTLVHAQCHFGLDTLSWARRGARVTGLDFSAPAIAAAREICHGSGLEGEFVHANVYDAIEALGARTFDIVYTGLGAINWLPDIEAWARIMTALTAPGGRFYLAEFHPFSDVFGYEQLNVEHSYFDRGPQIDETPGTYADLTAPTRHNRTVEWRHPIGDVVSALAGAGLRIDLLHEHDYTVFPRWPFLEHGEDQRYRLPADLPVLPLTYSLLATRPH